MCKCSVCEQAEQRVRNTEANKTSSLTSKAESTFIWQFAHNSISDACQCSAFSHHTHCPYRTVNQLFVSPSSLQSQHALPVPYCPQRALPVPYVNHFFASRFSLQSQHALPVPYCQPFLCKSIQLCIFLTLA